MKWLQQLLGIGQQHRERPAAVSALAQALEPRMMFDGALVATGAELVGDADAAPAPDSPADSPAAQEVVFIDAALASDQKLLGSLPAGAEVVVLDAGRDGLQQIADYLDGRQGLAAVHLLSHGEAGAFRAGSDWIDAASLQEHAEALARIGSALAENGDILLYGCQTGSGEAGSLLLDSLASLTRADVAASSDNTGAAVLGGNWVLEQAVGVVEAGALSLDGYDGLLAAPTSLNFDSFNLSADSDGDPLRSLGSSPRVIDGWTITLKDSAGNHASEGAGNYLDVTAATADNDLVNGSTDKALTVTGYYGIAATSGEEFSLQSFVIQNLNVAASALRVVGYRDGTAVASQDFSLTLAQISTVTLNAGADADWQNIDEFRIVEQSGAADIMFAIDDITVGPAVAPNVAPILANLNGDSVSYTEGGSAVLLDAGSNATLTDTDSADFNGGNVTVSITANGDASEDVLGVRHEGSGAGQIGVSGSNISYGGTLIGTASGGSAGSNLVISLNSSATPAAVQALVRNLTYTNSDDSLPSTLSRTVQVTVSDGDGGTSTAASVTVGVTAANDAPTLTATGATPTYTENASAVDLFSAVAIGTVEPGQTITGLTLTVSGLSDGASEVLHIDGSDVALTNGNSITTASNGMTVTVSLSGGTATVGIVKVAGISTAAAQSLVDGLSYRNASENPGTASRVVTLTSIQDSGGTANGGADTAALAVSSTVTVSAQNDAPVITLPGSLSVSEDVLTPITGISIADVDAGSGSLTVNLLATAGTLQASSSGGVVVTGSGSSSLTLTGTLENLNSFLASGKAGYLSVPDSTTSFNLVVLANDNAGGIDLEQLGVTVTAVNDAPVNTVPAAQSVYQDFPLVFTTANGNAISIGDVDAGSGNLQVTLSASNGSLSLSGIAGLSFTSGSGSDDASMTFSGSLAAINAALQGMTFTPTTSFTGAASLQIQTSDLGNTGSGGVQTDTDSVTIRVLELPPQVVSVTSQSSDGSYGIGDSLLLEVNFDQAVIVDTSGGSPTLLLETGAVDRVATYVSGSGSSTLVFSYSVQAGDVSADLNYQSTAALQLNGSTLKAGSGDAAWLTLPATGTASALAGGADLMIDGAQPLIASVSVPAAGSYNAGDTLSFSVSLDEAVSVSGGTPRLALDIGGVTRYATLVSGSGSSTLVFEYQVQAGDTDADGIAVSSLDANGATLQDTAGNDLNVTLNGVADSSAVLVDTLPPLVSGIRVLGGGVTAAGELSFLISFNEPVNGVDLSDFNLLLTGSASATLASVTAVDASHYRVTLTDVSGAGQLHLQLLGGGISDLAGNPTSSDTLSLAVVVGQLEGDPQFRLGVPGAAPLPGSGEVLYLPLPDQQLGLDGGSLFGNDGPGAGMPGLGQIFRDGGAHSQSLLARVFGQGGPGSSLAGLFVPGAGLLATGLPGGQDDDLCSESDADCLLAGAPSLEQQLEQLDAQPGEQRELLALALGEMSRFER